MSTRYTVELLASGQPRAYADSEYHVRIIFEWNGWNSKEPGFVPCYVSEESARLFAKALPASGYTDKVAKDCEWYETRLDWFKAMDPKPASEIILHGDPKQVLGSVWEFHTTSPYTD